MTMDDRFEHELRTRVDVARVRGHVRGGWADVERRAAGPTKHSPRRTARRGLVIGAASASLALLVVALIIVQASKDTSPVRAAAPHVQTVRFTRNQVANFSTRTPGRFTRHGVSTDVRIDFTRHIYWQMAIDWPIDMTSVPAPISITTDNGTWMYVPDGRLVAADLRGRTAGKAWVHARGDGSIDWEAEQRQFADPLAPDGERGWSAWATVGQEIVNRTQTTHSRRVGTDDPRMTQDVWTDAEGRLVQSRSRYPSQVTQDVDSLDIMVNTSAYDRPMDGVDDRIPAPVAEPPASDTLEVSSGQAQALVTP